MNKTALLALILIALMVSGSGCLGFGLKSPSATQAATPPPATTPVTTVPAVTTPVTTAVPTTVPEPYPNALRLKEIFNYSSGKTASEGTVYRYWLNDTYQLYDPDETRYITQHPSPGNRYLIIFVNAINRGTVRILPPRASTFMVHYGTKTMYMDRAHKLPMTTQNVDSPPKVYRIGEVEFQHKFVGSEYVEDFGYSHGMQQAYLTPGESNAIDGYVVFEVPADLVPERTYVEIPFTNTDVGVWKLA